MDRTQAAPGLPPPQDRAAGLRSFLTLYGNRQVGTMVALGISAGLPLPLVTGTPAAWLYEQGLSLSNISLIGGIGFLYGLKFLWAPLLDRIHLPGSLGHRRSWMLLMQAAAMAALVLIAFSNPAPGDLSLFLVGLLALAAASASQDIALDAFRIESAPPEVQGALSASYVLGYRIAWQLIGGAACLWLAEMFGWQVAYLVMAASMLIGVGAILLSPEPSPIAKPVARASGRREMVLLFLRPLQALRARMGWKLLLVTLGLVLTFRVCDLVLGAIAYPFYLSVGFDKAQIAAVTKLYGFPLLLLGAVLGGWLVRLTGPGVMLVPAALLALGSNLGFLLLASSQPDLGVFALVVAFDNIASGIATASFIAFLSSLAVAPHTAAQYAILSSVMVQLGKTLSLASGGIVEQIDWPGFFIYSAVVGLPAVGFALWRRRLVPSPRALRAAGGPAP